MSDQITKNPADYIVPININGLEGRMLKSPTNDKKHTREILLLYGHHAMLERWWSLVENLNDYGNVTMPDLPGFGGMDSFYKIGITPDVDAFADYLAAFIKLRFRRKKVTVVAISYGFAIITRTLQKYPELTNKVELLISLVGFMHSEDLIYSPRQQVFFRYGARLFATRPVALFIKYIGLNPPVIRRLHAILPNKKRRIVEVTLEEFDNAVEFDIKLWQINDVRTHWLTTSQFFTLDNCRQKVDLPVIHVVSKQEHYFNNEIVKQHMLVVFKRYRRYVAQSKAHTPHVLADKAAMSVMLPPGLRRQLAKTK